MLMFMLLAILGQDFLGAIPATSFAHITQKHKRVLLEDSNNTETDATANSSWVEDLVVPDVQNNYNFIERVKKIDNNIRQNSSSVEQYPFIKSSIHSYIAICAIMRDEHRYIEEWLLYHIFIGVKKFYLYDNLSKPPMWSLLQDFIVQGLVEYTYVTTQWMTDEFGYNDNPSHFLDKIMRNSPQRWAHYTCFSQHKTRHKFMAMIDIDEFIVLNQGKENGFKPVEHPDLPTFLKNYESYGGLFVYWRQFGSSGHIQIPQDLVLRSYVHCTEKMRPISKPIVNMQFFMGSCVVHYCNTSVPSVNAEFKEVKGNYQVPPSWEGIVLHHYIYKSFEDMQKKLIRGGGHFGTDSKYKSFRSKQHFYQVDKQSNGNCSYMIDVGSKCCSKVLNHSFIDQQ